MIEIGSSRRRPLTCQRLVAQRREAEPCREVASSLESLGRRRQRATAVALVGFRQGWSSIAWLPSSLARRASLGRAQPSQTLPSPSGGTVRRAETGSGVRLWHASHRQIASAQQHPSCAMMMDLWMIGGWLECSARCRTPQDFDRATPLAGDFSLRLQRHLVRSTRPDMDLPVKKVAIGG